jgi:tetratricopeptide (TPR) repeat protein
MLRYSRFSYINLLREKNKNTMTSEDYYRLGNSYRKKGDFKHAIDSYMEAIALDSNSPAVEAKKMLENIFAFYCKDMYNP